MNKRAQKDTNTDELMREDLLEILQRAGRDETPEEARWALIQLSFMQMSMGSQGDRIWLMGTQSVFCICILYKSRLIGKLYQFDQFTGVI